MQEKNIDTFCPKDRKDWRKWLKENHSSKQSVSLIYYKKQSDRHTMTWSDAVEEALCFGWIDSTRRSRDSESFTQLFTKRKPKSVWSKINKEKVQRLIDEGLMTPAGLQSIEIAKQNGSWEILDSVEELEIPKDLAKEFRSHPGSKVYFSGLSKSVKKMMLQWIILAKRPETRQKRITEIAILAAKQQRPKQFN